MLGCAASTVDSVLCANCVPKSHNYHDRKVTVDPAANPTASMAGAPREHCTLLFVSPLFNRFGGLGGIFELPGAIQRLDHCIGHRNATMSRVAAWSMCSNHYMKGHIPMNVAIATVSWHQPASSLQLTPSEPLPTLTDLAFERAVVSQAPPLHPLLPTPKEKMTDGTSLHRVCVSPPSSLTFATHP